MTASDSRLRVVIAALTYRRPDDLAALLPALTAQAGSVPEDVEILIVDNDPDASARVQVESFGQGVRYEHVPTPGIAAARNGALDAAGVTDVLVFIDDDERPVERWLEHLLGVWRLRRSAGVVGPVISAFEVEPEAWIRAGRFFERRRLTTGTTVDIAATNNLLLDLRFVNRVGLRFDLRFGLSGGSDTLFSRQLTAAGGELVWCDEAIVTDVVPASRVTRRWVLQRAYRSGNSWIRTALEVQTRPLARLMVRAGLSLRGLLRVGAGGLLVALGAVSGQLPWRARGMRTAARGAGLLTGAFGTVYTEYRRAT